MSDASKTTDPFYPAFGRSIISKEPVDRRRDGNDSPRLDIDTEALRIEVEMLLAAAGEAENMGAVNWGDLGVHDIEYRLSMLTPQDGPHCVVMIEEASPDCRLPQFLYDNWDHTKFPCVYFECEW